MVLIPHWRLQSRTEDGDTRLECTIDKPFTKVHTVVDGIKEQLGEAELHIRNSNHKR